MPATLVRPRKTEQEFDADMRRLEISLTNIIHNLPPQNVSLEQRIWVRGALEAAARFIMSDSSVDRRALDQILRSPPRGTSSQLISLVSSTINDAISIPETRQQKSTVCTELERVAHEVFRAPRFGERSSPGASAPQSEKRPPAAAP